MSKYAFCIFIFLLVGKNLLAQDTEHKVKVSLEIPVSVSMIPASWQTFTYGTTSINLPRLNNYRNPVYGINVGVLYSFTEKIHAGVVIGINGSFYQNHLYYADEYLNMLMIPAMARISLSPKISQRFYSVSDISAGYNFYHNVSGNTSSGFNYEERGGAKAIISSGIGYKVGDRLLVLQVGYDMTVYNNKARLNKLVNVTNPDTDFVKYKTWYQTFLVKLGILL